MSKALLSCAYPHLAYTPDYVNQSILQNFRHRLQVESHDSWEVKGLDKTAQVGVDRNHCTEGEKEEATAGEDYHREETVQVQRDYTPGGGDEGNEDQDDGVQNVEVALHAEVNVVRKEAEVEPESADPRASILASCFS